MAIDWASVFAGLAVGLAIALLDRWRLRRQVLQAIAALDPDSTDVALSLSSLLRRSVVRSLEITEHWRQELGFWQRITHQLPVAVLWVDEEDGVLWSNQAAQTLLHLTPDQMDQDLSLMALVRSYDLDCLVQDTRRSGHNQQRDWVFDPLATLHTRAGRTPSELTQFQPQPQELLHQRAIALRGYGIAMDQGHVAVVLENHQAYADLRDSRDRLTNDLAHELRTPLTSIQLVFETLQGQLDPPYSQWVDRAIPEVSRLVAFVQDWLSLSQLEKSEQPSLRLAPLDIQELLITVWHTLSPLAEQKSIQCTLGCTSDQGEVDDDELDQDFAALDPESDRENFQDISPSLWLLGDPYRLHRLFQNLIDNAIKFSPNHSQIHIKVHLVQLSALYPLPNRPIRPRTDSLALDIATFDPEQWSARSDAQDLRLWVIVDVIDGGQGFKPDDLTYAFDRLYRGDPSRGRSPNPLELGTSNIDTSNIDTSSPEDQAHLQAKSTVGSGGGGLGLAIARRIAIAHGGSIIAANHPDTQGAWLQVRLPYRCSEFSELEAPLG